MANFTSGHLSVWIATVKTSATLQQIQQEMHQQRPSHATMTPGWSSIYDDTALLNTISPPPPLSDPVVDDATPSYPERLLGRLYLWATDPGARRALGTTAPPQQTHRLRAVDFMFSRIDADSVMVVISTRNWHEQQAVKPPLEALVGAVDGQALVQMDSSALDLNDDDIFMWLLHRSAANTQLTPGLKLDKIREITSQDVLSRGANLSHGVDLSRRELLALVTNHSIRFGPAKMVVHYDDTNAYLDFELFKDGGFSVNTNGSQYAAVMSRSVIGPLAMQDLVFGVIPTLREAFSFDADWVSADRTTFLDTCLQGLQGLAGGAAGAGTDVTCPHCGELVHA